MDSIYDEERVDDDAELGSRVNRKLHERTHRHTIGDRYGWKGPTTGHGSGTGNVGGVGNSNTMVAPHPGMKPLEQEQRGSGRRQIVRYPVREQFTRYDMHFAPEQDAQQISRWHYRRTEVPPQQIVEVQARRRKIGEETGTRVRDMVGSHAEGRREVHDSRERTPASREWRGISSPQAKPALHV